MITSKSSNCPRCPSGGIAPCAVQVPVTCLLEIPLPAATTPTTCRSLLKKPQHVIGGRSLSEVVRQALHLGSAQPD